MGDLKRIIIITSNTVLDASTSHPINYFPEMAAILNRQPFRKFKSLSAHLQVLTYLCVKFQKDRTVHLRYSVRTSSGLRRKKERKKGRKKEREKNKKLNKNNKSPNLRLGDLIRITSNTVLGCQHKKSPK